LASKWAGTHDIQLIEQANHDNIPDNESYWNAIRQFLAKLAEYNKSSTTN
jgi:hypothetical protein